jgi:hypothetical protein
MMKKRKFGSGGMPSMKESMESGNRVSRQVGAETKKLMPATRSTRPSVGDAIASGNRMSKKNAEDMKAVKKYAAGGNISKQIQSSIAANTPKPMGQTTAAYGADLREQVKAGKMTNAQAQAAQNAFVKQQVAARSAADAKATDMGGIGVAPKPGFQNPPSRQLTAPTGPAPVSRGILGTQRPGMTPMPTVGPPPSPSIRTLPGMTPPKSSAPYMPTATAPTGPAPAGPPTTPAAAMRMKKGGKVSKPIKKMAKGGSVSSRADGCAVRGKTKGKIC